MTHIHYAIDAKPQSRTLTNLAVLFLMTAGWQVHAAPTAVATYDFNNTLNAAEPGATSLTAIDPLGMNGFLVDSVFGETKTVYRFDGANNPSSQQGGLSLNTTGLLSGPAYSIDLIFLFERQGPTWERILDASNRSSDNGFYVEPGGKLQIYPVGNGPSNFIFNSYQRVTLTNNGAGNVTAYWNGIFQFDLTTNVMDFGSYAANPNNLLTFFADNTSGPAQTEWVPGRVSLVRLYDFELTRDEVVDVGDESNDVVTSVPEPATLGLLGLGFAGLAAIRRKKPSA